MHPVAVTGMPALVTFYGLWALYFLDFRLSNEEIISEDREDESVILCDWTVELTAVAILHIYALAPHMSAWH